jgi:hypothetical protein
MHGSKVSKDLLKVSNVCQWHIVYRPPNNACSNFNHEAAAMSDLGRLLESTAVVLEYCGYYPGGLDLVKSSALQSYYYRVGVLLRFPLIIIFCALN